MICTTKFASVTQGKGEQKSMYIGHQGAWAIYFIIIIIYRQPETSRSSVFHKQRPRRSLENTLMSLRVLRDKKKKKVTKIYIRKCNGIYRSN